MVLITADPKLAPSSERNQPERREMRRVESFREQAEPMCERCGERPQRAGALCRRCNFQYGALKWEWQKEKGRKRRKG